MDPDKGVAVTTKDTQDDETRAAAVKLLVPDSAKDNYREALTVQARREGRSLADVRGDQIEAWRAQADNDPQSAPNLNALADWLDSVSVEELTTEVTDAAATARVKGKLAVMAEGLSKYPIDLSDADKDEIVAYREAVAGTSPDALAQADAAATGAGPAEVGKDLTAAPAPADTTPTGKSPVTGKSAGQK